MKWIIPLVWLFSTASMARSHHAEWSSLQVGRGDHLLGLFKQAKLSHQAVYDMLALGPIVDPLKHLYVGQTLKILHKGDEVLSLSMTYGSHQRLEIKKEDSHYKASVHNLTFHRHYHVAQVPITHYLSEDGRAKHVPQAILLQAGRLFEQRFWPAPLYRNDEIDLIYSEEGEHLTLEGMRYSHLGQNTWWIGYTNHHGVQGFYDQYGHNLGQAFDRAPLKYQWVSSKFRWHRLHPVLHHIRPHKGVDLAANRGTKVRATADGVVKYVGYNGGYGRMVKLQHGPHIKTIYAHFSRFAKKLHRGQKVHRHQVIGYVGQSGLATGPHCHYEFRINNIPHDPLKVHLPSYPSLAGADKKIFLQKRWPWVKNILS